MVAEYAWIIDVDHSPDPNYPEGSYCNAKGVCGPSTAPDNLLDILRNTQQGRRFKIFDDDGELYYEGRIIVDVPDGYDLQDEHFGPLWDFGTPNAGATDIQYLNDSGLWETL